jgi:hypothetical protein
MLLLSTVSCPPEARKGLNALWEDADILATLKLVYPTLLLSITDGFRPLTGQLMQIASQRTLYIPIT